jgi:hypothetical protein
MTLRWFGWLLLTCVAGCSASASVGVSGDAGETTETETRTSASHPIKRVIASSESISVGTASSASSAAPTSTTTSESSRTSSATAITSGSTASTSASRAPVDAGHDAGHDAARDTGRDAKVGDAPHDAGRDATLSDAAHDSGRDAKFTDAAHDATPDAPADARRDATSTLDAKRDSAADSGRDATLDSGADAVTDAIDSGPPGPMLASLTVSPLTLEPAFAPDVHDYYVRCAAGTNSLTVSVTAAGYATTNITSPAASGPAQEQTVTLDVLENQAIVATATLGPASTEYWVRCLPHDFPLISTTLHPEAGAPPAGYYFIGNVFKSNAPNPPDGSYGMVLDVRGTPVWYGRTVQGNFGAKLVELLDPNTIVYVPNFGDTLGEYVGSFELHTLNPVGVRYLATVGMPLDTHELRIAHNGDYLLFASPIVGGFDLGPYDGGFGPDANVLDCVLQELSPDGGLVWQWTASDHVDIVKETTQPGNITVTNDAGKPVVALEAFHCNSIDEDPNGDLLVSMRNLDAVFLVSRATGTMIWKMGGTAYNKDNATHITVENDPLHGFYRQHHVTFQPDGTITVFDDETSRGNVPARGLQLTVSPDAGSATIVWQADEKPSTIGMGSVTILPDGSHVIGWGYPAIPNIPQMTEFNAAGDDVLDFYYPGGDSSYRALKVQATAVDLETLRTSIGSWSSGNGVPPDAGHD